MANLTVTNNWEDLSYKWKGKPVQGITRVRSGLTIYRFYTAQMAVRVRTVHDMGRTYPTNTRVLEVWVDDFSTWLALDHDAALAGIDSIEVDGQWLD